LIKTIPSVKANYFQFELPAHLFNLIKNLTINYFITSIIEMLVITAFFNYSKRLVITILWINLITNPAYQLFVWTFSLTGPLLILILTIVIGEILSIYLESILLIERLASLEIESKNSQVYSIVFIANLFTLGIAIFPIFIWPPIFLTF
jgi:lipid-A-disaccharide synthase-like uncharacterized protein